MIQAIRARLKAQLASFIIINIFHNYQVNIGPRICVLVEKERRFMHSTMLCWYPLRTHVH